MSKELIYQFKFTMFINFNLNSSALKQVIYQKNGIKIDIHITSVLILLLAFANYFSHGVVAAFEAISAMTFAYITIEVFLVYELLTAKKSINKINFCLYPFGILSDARAEQSKYFNKKYYFSMALFLICFYLLISNAEISELLNYKNLLPKNFFQIYISTLGVLSIINTLPIAPLPGFVLSKKISIKNNLAISYIPIIAIIFAIFLAYQLNNLYMLICVITLALISMREGFYAKTIDKAKGYQVKDFYTPISNFVSFNKNMSVNRALIEILKYQQTSFPIFAEGDFLGFVFKDQVVNALGNKNIESIKELLVKDFIKVEEDTQLSLLTSELIDKSIRFFAVYKQEELKGFLLPENLVENMLIRDLIDRSEQRHDDPFEDEMF